MKPAILKLFCNDQRWQLKLDSYLRERFDVDLIGFDFVRDGNFCRVIAAQYGRVFNGEAGKSTAQFRTSD
jgi:hypothetical protein